MKHLSQYIIESSNKEIKNPKLIKALKLAGLGDVVLVKGNGYFYVWGKEGSEMEDLMASAYDTSIYVNAFNQLSIDDWVAEIRQIVDGAKNK